jgi:Pyruvate/2-oxoacid:ferredoxin oxidoreductase delta subunit
VPGVWAGGDVTNLDVMTTAVGHGRRAAEAIERSFLGTEVEVDRRKIIHTDGMMLDHYEKMGRQEPAVLPIEERLGSLDVEVNIGLSREAALQESRRCMSCGQCFYCEKCWLYCSDQAIEKPMQKGALYAFKLQNCTGCKKCAEICPCGFIEMR